jgi:CubicO group peptidase (beta-lactamase class C family)
MAEAPATKPGGDFVYSNTAFLIAALVAERATGKPFEELMRDEVFRPPGMTGAEFGPTSDTGIRGRRAGKPVGRMLKSDGGVPMVYTSAGNSHMSLQDWARFCVDQSAGSRGEGVLLSPESYRLMQTAQPGSGSGMDWGVQDSIGGYKGPVLVHGGSDGNWLAWVVLLPDARSGALVVANAANDMGADKATHAVVGALLPSFSTTR